MGFLQLFAALLVFGFALASLRNYLFSKELHWLYLGLAFSIYCLALILELVLGYVFNDQALRLWYWLRHILLLPAFGLGLLVFIYKDRPRQKYVERGIWAAALAGLVLVALTAITRAIDWYDPNLTIYAQYVDLLARNRPTRWLTYMLNGFGMGAALLLLGVGLARKYDRKRQLSLIVIGIAIAAVLLQTVFIEQGLFRVAWLVPVLSSVLLYVGLRGLTGEQQLPFTGKESPAGWRGILKWNHVVIALVLVLGIQLRMTSYGDPSLSVSNYDSVEFIRASERDVFSIDFFTSNRPATIVLFYKLLEPATGYELTNLSSPAESLRIEKTMQPGLDRIALGQMWVAIFCWSALALSLARRVKNPVLKILIVILTLTFAFSPNLADWDSVLLSESLALALFALILAATLELVPLLLEDSKRIKPTTVALLAVWAIAMALWVFSRDTNSYMLLVMLASVIALLLFPGVRQKYNWRVLLFIAVFIAGLFMFQNRTLATSDRWVNPFFNNMLFNVFPYPERMTYFAAQGMPLTDEVLAFRDGLPNQDGFWEIPYLMDWVFAEGYNVYTRFLITHPGYTFQKVLDSFSVVFTENVQPFFSSDPEHTPQWMYYLGSLLHPVFNSVMFIVVLLTGLLVWQAFSTRGEKDVLMAGLFTMLVLGLFAMLAVSVLGDGLSTIRHAMVAVVPFRLFLWLLTIIVVDRLFLPSAVSERD
ncbi:MAG: hypothetical protein DWQ07_05535 [Chloroflexi bacterium]|nr:MAG: hypothetical protein DWQ07_05535 [Chloroflexota bacterium]MBL1194893.1 hypothetical protein [Chloroflexota bacterium]NOH12184.1 hypothetical protein [Chloroflexota bacterium]